MHSRVGDVSVLLHRMRELNVDSAARTEELNHLEGVQDLASDAKEWGWKAISRQSRDSTDRTRKRTPVLAA